MGLIIEGRRIHYFRHSPLATSPPPSYTPPIDQPRIRPGLCFVAKTVRINAHPTGR